MPRGDRTGPMGMGPLTGRGAGFCAGFSIPGCRNFPGWAGFGRGRGLGRMFYATGMPGWAAYPPYPWAHAPNIDEKDVLRSQAEALENELHHIKKRLESLEKKED